jgi:ABC-type amino acid transport substrate-binding protein
MVKVLTVALVVIMLLVGFAVGLFSAPTIMPYKPATPEATPSPQGSSTPAPTATTDTVWANIQATHIIKIGTDATWPPYQMRNNVTNEIEGFEVDLANAVAAKLGLTVQWNDVSFDTIIISVQDKSFDMGVSGFSVNAERLQEVSFTLPHSTTEGQIIMLQSAMQAKNVTTLSSLADFKTHGITVGVQSGNVQEEELRAAGVDVQVWPNSDSPFLDMISGNPSVQAVYAETPITTNWINTFASQGKTASAVYSHPYYPVAFLVNKQSLTLLDQVNGALATLIHDGVVDQLKTKWQIPLA